jgi:acyl carrier protein
MDIETKVKAICREELGLDREAHLTDRIDEDLGADSLDRYELSMALEAAFAIAIPDEQASALVTVGDVVAYVQRQVLAKTGTAA